jgi:DNA-binding SARP family transcriptional activator
MLGGFQVRSGDRVVAPNAWRLRKAASLVKILALAPAHQLHRDQLIELLWADLPFAAASNNLYQALHVARHALSRLPSGTRRTQLLRLNRQVVSLDSPLGVIIDVDEFEHAAAYAGQTGAADDLAAAIDLYHGELLPEDRYEEWADARRRALHDTYVNLLIALADRHEARREHHTAVDLFRRVTEIDPVIEHAHHNLMELYAQLGRPRQALRQYERLREVLAREADSAPSGPTRELARRIERDMQ